MCASAYAWLFVNLILAGMLSVMAFMLFLEQYDHFGKTEALQLKQECNYGSYSSYLFTMMTKSFEA